MRDDHARMVEAGKLHRVRLAKAKAGGCVDCGTHEGTLDFHHLNPATKRAAVSTMVTWGTETFWAEVAKCVVLCRPCHTLRHIKEKTHCPHGHEYTPENTYWRMGQWGNRVTTIVEPVDEPTETPP